jgi:anti-sigma factor RsiW
MNHRDAWEFLDDYLDGTLPAEARWAVTAHVNDCVECRQRLAELARLRKVVRDNLAAIEAPPGLSDRLRLALAAEAAATPRRQLVFWPPPQVLGLVAVLALVLAGLWLLARAVLPLIDVAPDLKTELTVAHLVFAQDTSKLDVTGDAATVESWFRDEAGLSVAVPEIDGFALSGARLVVVDGQPTAQLVYQSDPDHIYLSLLRFKDRGVNLAGTEERDGYAVGQQGITSLLTWAVGGDRTVLVGEVPEADLRRIAGDLSTRLPALPTVAPLTPRPIPAVDGDQWPSRYME